MEFYMSEKFKIATEKANLVIGKLNIKENNFIKTEDLVDVVEELTNAKILVAETDFEKINKSAKRYGAMMNISNGKDNIKSVIIVLNSNRCIDAKFKRFSLAHELGHLITEKYTFSDEKKKFILSTHIDYTLNKISEEECEKDEHLFNEEIANIFALKVLMPIKLLRKALESIKDIKEISNHFGVSEDAVLSRIILELGD